MKTTLVYDGSIEGLLTSLFIIFKDQIKHPEIVKESNYQPSFFDDKVDVVTDSLLADRVLLGLKKRISKRFIQFFYTLHNDRDNLENVLYDYVRYIFSSSNGSENDFGHPSVLTVSKNFKMINREKHRMEAFVRFRYTKDGIYFASIEPDFDVVPLIKKHFFNRYKDQKWLIYDIKRDYGIYYDLEKVDTISLTLSTEKGDLLKSSSDLFTSDELSFQKLWALYFKHTNIESRKNSKLHIRHVPKRYWKYLSEKRSD